MVVDSVAKELLQQRTHILLGSGALEKSPPTEGDQAAIVDELSFGRWDLRRVAGELASSVIYNEGNGPVRVDRANKVHNLEDYDHFFMLQYLRS